MNEFDREKQAPKVPKRVFSYVESTDFENLIIWLDQVLDSPVTLDKVDLADLP